MKEEVRRRRDGRGEAEEKGSVVKAAGMEWWGQRRETVLHIKYICCVQFLIPASRGNRRHQEKRKEMELEALMPAQPPQDWYHGQWN